MRKIKVSLDAAIVNPEYKAVIEGTAFGAFTAECKEGHVSITPSMNGFCIRTPKGSWDVSKESLEKIAEAFYGASYGHFALHNRGKKV